VSRWGEMGWQLVETFPYLETIGFIAKSEKLLNIAKKFSKFKDFAIEYEEIIKSSNFLLKELCDGKLTITSIGRLGFDLLTKDAFKLKNILKMPNFLISKCSNKLIPKNSYTKFSNLVDFAFDLDKKGFDDFCYKTGIEPSKTNLGYFVVADTLKVKTENVFREYSRNVSATLILNATEKNDYEVFGSDGELKLREIYDVNRQKNNHCSFNLSDKEYYYVAVIINNDFGELIDEIL